MVDYKEVASVQQIHHDGTLQVEVLLSEKPDEDWIQEFWGCSRASVVCPASDLRGDRLVFMATRKSVQSRLDALRRVIKRTNGHLKGKKAVVTSIGKPEPSPEGDAGDILKALKERGY